MRRQIVRIIEHRLFKQSALLEIIFTANEEFISIHVPLPENAPCFSTCSLPKAGKFYQVAARQLFIIDNNHVLIIAFLC